MTDNNIITGIEIEVNDVNMDEYSAIALRFLEDALIKETGDITSCSLKMLPIIEKNCVDEVREKLFKHIMAKDIVMKSTPDYSIFFGTPCKQPLELLEDDVPESLLDVYAIIPDFHQRVCRHCQEFLKKDLVDRIQKITKTAVA